MVECRVGRGGNEQNGCKAGDEVLGVENSEGDGRMESEGEIWGHIQERLMRGVGMKENGGNFELRMSSLEDGVQFILLDPRFAVEYLG